MYRVRNHEEFTESFSLCDQDHVRVRRGRVRTTREKVRAFIARKKMYVCDVCGMVHRTGISLRVHWRHAHMCTAARIDTYR